MNAHATIANVRSPEERSSPGQQYTREEVVRMLGISPQRLRGWSKQGFLRDSSSFTFSDLIALRTLKSLAEAGVPPKRIALALQSLKKKLAHVAYPLSEAKVIAHGRSIAVRHAGEKMEAVTGQLLFDFDASDLSSVRSFQAPAPKPEAPKIDERQAEYWFHRGLDLEESAAPVSEAIAAYEKAVELNPNAAGALVNLGTIFYHVRKYDEARRHYERAIEVDPKYPLAHFNLGNLCDECNLIEEARGHYKTALAINPEYADAHYNMALLCERTGEFLGATKHWKNYLKVDPASSWSNIARRQLEKLRQATVVGARRSNEAG